MKGLWYFGAWVVNIWKRNRKRRWLWLIAFYVALRIILFNVNYYNIVSKNGNLLHNSYKENVTEYIINVDTGEKMNVFKYLEMIADSNFKEHLQIPDDVTYTCMYQDGMYLIYINLEQNEKYLPDIYLKRLYSKDFELIEEIKPTYSEDKYIKHIKQEMKNEAEQKSIKVVWRLFFLILFIILSAYMYIIFTRY